jgi:hypothetical protein
MEVEDMLVYDSRAQSVDPSCPCQSQAKVFALGENLCTQLEP